MSQKNDVTVPLGGQEIKADGDPPKRPRTLRMSAEQSETVATVSAVGAHLEQKSPDGGTRVESHPAEGGKAVSGKGADGSYSGQFSGPLLRGKDDEPRAVRILTAKLEGLGHDVVPVTEEDKKAKDERGEDRKLLVDGIERVVQVVTMPIDKELWKKVGDTRTAEMSGHDAVRLVRDCIEKKCNKAKGTVLVLDAAHIGAVPSQDLVDNYLKTYRDPIKECGFFEVWIVGPTEARTFKLA